MEYRRASEQDIETLCRLREQQLVDEGLAPQPDIHGELAAFFAAGFADGSLLSFLCECSGSAVAACSLSLMRLPPAYNYPSGVYGYLHSVYTHKDYRGRGIARALVQACTDTARALSAERVFLVASPAGQPVYQKEGFQEDKRFMSNWHREG